MEYICLDCGNRWPIRRMDIRLGYRRCPKCRSYDTAPASFWKMVEVGKELGISDNTPCLDVLDAFKSVWGEESLLELGLAEFWRVMKRVIKEIENPSHAKRGEL